MSCHPIFVQGLPGFSGVPGVPGTDASSANVVSFANVPVTFNGSGGIFFDTGSVPAFGPNKSLILTLDSPNVTFTGETVFISYFELASLPPIEETLDVFQISYQIIGGEVFALDNLNAGIDVANNRIIISGIMAIPVTGTVSFNINFLLSYL